MMALLSLPFAQAVLLHIVHSPFIEPLLCIVPLFIGELFVTGVEGEVSGHDDSIPVDMRLPFLLDHFQQLRTERGVGMRNDEVVSLLYEASELMMNVTEIGGVGLHDVGGGFVREEERD
jgi:hypothetical protein